MEVLAQNRFSHHLTLDIWGRVDIFIRCSHVVYRRLGEKHLWLKITALSSSTENILADSKQDYIT